MRRSTIVLLVASACAMSLAVGLPLEFTATSSKWASIGVCALGFVVGCFGTLIGAGGGFLVVPFLLIAYHAEPGRAAGTSLVVVLLNALTGTGAYVRQRRIDYRAGMAFALATLPGAVLGSWLTTRIPAGPFQVAFGVLLLLLAVLVFLGRPREGADPRLAEATRGEGAWVVSRTLKDAFGETHAYRYNEAIGVQVSFVVGIVSSLLGIGGGVIHVPALVFLLGFPAHVATATSHFVLAITAAAGVAGHASLGHVWLGPALLLGSGAVCGAPVGARLAQRVKGVWIVRLLALGLVALGLRLLWR